MTKEEAYEIIEKRYGDYEFGDYIDWLCISSPREIRHDFSKYWRIIKEHHVVVSSYLGTPCESILEHKTLISLTRLLTLHMFIEDYYD